MSKGSYTIKRCPVERLSEPLRGELVENKWAAIVYITSDNATCMAYEREGLRQGFRGSWKFVAGSYALFKRVG